MLKYTALIVPALSDQAGQCRIVACEGDIRKALQDYRSNPDAWKETGLMNSQGKLVWCHELGDLREQLKKCEPLMAGTTFLIDVPEESAPAPRDPRPWRRPRRVG